MSRKRRTCLVLGGGGVRGLAHLGVLEVLERHRIAIDCIVGTSVGAVVGAGYALRPDAATQIRQAIDTLRSEAFAGNAFKAVLLKSGDMEQSVLRSTLHSIRRGYVFSNLLRKASIFPGEKLLEVVCDLVPDRDFSDVKIPFAVSALDIRAGREVLLEKGSLRTACLASCSLPGFFPPVERDGMLLADAGVIGPVPVSRAAHFHPRTIIAVDITSRVEALDTVQRGIDAILRVESLACARLNAAELSRADVVIQPRVGDKDWSDFSEFEKLVAEGVRAAGEKLPEVRAAVKRGRRPRWFFWRPPRPR